MAEAFLRNGEYMEAWEASVDDKTRKQSQDERSRGPAAPRKEFEPKQDKTVADPHAGSVSDGTHSEASEAKR